MNRADAIDRKGKSVKRKFIAALVLAAASAALALVTVAWPEWLESVFGIHPDRESGSAEWFIALAFGLIAISAGVLAYVQWKRADAAAAWRRQADAADS
jgi:hypothetical protein